MMVQRRVVYTVIAYISLATYVHCALETLGDSDTVALQAHHQFDGKDNTMARSALMLNGFRFLDENTTASFRSSLPAAGNIFFNGGRIFLGKDLILRNPAHIRSGGLVFGNDRAIEFPCTKRWSIGDSPCITPFSLEIDSQSAGGNVRALDWSFDDQYLAVGTALQIGTELRIYSFDGTSLTLSASREIGSDVDSVRWHPTDHFFAVGFETDEVHVYEFDTGTNALGLADTRSFPATNGSVFSVHTEGVDWDPSGDFLGVHIDHISGTLNEAEVVVLGFDTGSGLLSHRASFTFTQAEAEVNPFSWSPTGTFIAVGFEGGGGISAPAGLTPTVEFGVRVLSYNGSATLTEVGSATIDADVLSVDWHPTGSYLAVGINNESGITETLRVYEFDMVAQTLTQTAVVGESQTVYEVQWSKDGSCLYAGIDSGATNGVRNYFFDQDQKELFAVDEFSVGFDVSAFRTSPSNRYFGVGLSNGNTDVRVYGMDDFGPLTFINTHLCFNSEVTLNTTLRFEGECSISGRGNIFDLSSGHTIVLAPGARLCLRDLYMRGVGSQSPPIVFSDNDATLNLANVDIELVSTVTTTIGNISIVGPSSWYIGKHSWVFEQAATLSVDGVTLWKDSLNTPWSNAGTIDVGVANQFFDSVNAGTIKCRASVLDLVSSAVLASDLIDTPHIGQDTLLSAPVSEDNLIGPATSKLMTDNMYLAPMRRLRVAADSLLSGSGHYLDFSQAKEPVLLIDAGVTLSLHDITLRNFAPEYVRYGDAASRLLFGSGTTIELGKCSELKAIVDGVEQSITWTFQASDTGVGACIKGGRRCLIFAADNPVSIQVDPRMSLTIDNLIIEGLGAKPYNMRAINPESNIALKNTTLILSENYSFTQGTIEILNDTTIRGSYTFAYESGQVSHTRPGARLYLDYGTTFSYDAQPNGALGDDAKRKFVLDDISSVLHLRGATLHATQTGMLLDSGTLRVEDDSFLTSQAQQSSQAIVLASTMMNIDILANAQLAMRGQIETR